VLQQKWLALLSRLSYVGILETLAVLLRPLALAIESAVAFLLGGEDLRCRLALTLRAKSNFAVRACSLDLDWVETSLVCVKGSQPNGAE